MGQPRRTIAVVTPPDIEPVGLEEAKEWARVTDSADDGLMAALITSATASVELYLKRSLVTRTLKLTLDLPTGGRDLWAPGFYELPVNTFDGSLPDTIPLLRPAAQAISSVVTYSTANVSSTYSASNYRLAGDRLVLNDSATWPTGLRAVGAMEITYTAGYGDAAGDVPQPIRHAVMMTAAALFDGRGQCDASGLAPGAARLLNQYRVWDDQRG